MSPTASTAVTPKPSAADGLPAAQNPQLVNPTVEVAGIPFPGVEDRLRSIVADYNKLNPDQQIHDVKVSPGSESGTYDIEAVVGEPRETITLTKTAQELMKLLADPQAGLEALIKEGRNPQQPPPNHADTPSAPEQPEPTDQEPPQDPQITNPYVMVRFDDSQVAVHIRKGGDQQPIVPQDNTLSQQVATVTAAINQAVVDQELILSDIIIDPEQVSFTLVAPGQNPLDPISVNAPWGEVAASVAEIAPQVAELAKQLNQAAPANPEPPMPGPSDSRVPAEPTPPTAEQPPSTRPPMDPEAERARALAAIDRLEEQGYDQKLVEKLRQEVTKEQNPSTIYDRWGQILNIEARSARQQNVTNQP